MENANNARQYLALESGTLHYAWSGSGEQILLLLHGNTASSRMFQPVLPLYERHFRVLVMDCLGHGRSDRLDAFPPDLWHSQAAQAAQLLDALGLRSVNVVGTSGGALAALNLALERPDLVRKAIADSFEGENALDAVALTIEAERARAKTDPATVRFWRECHGEDWEAVVDNDTRAIQRHHAAIKTFFHQDIATLAMPVLLTASLEDEFADIAHFQETYARMLAKIPKGAKHLFPTGGHPALLSNAEGFAALAETFFLRQGEYMGGITGCYTIRLAKENDIPLLDAIEAAAGAIFPPGSLPENVLAERVPYDVFMDAVNQGRLLVVVDAAHVPVGFAFWQDVDGSALLALIEVHPQHGRKGLGRALVLHIIEQVAKAGFPSLYLTTFSDIPWNAPFYQKLGFVLLDAANQPDFIKESLRDEEGRGLSNRVGMWYVIQS